MEKEPKYLLQSQQDCGSSSCFLKLFAFRENLPVGSHFLRLVTAQRCDNPSRLSNSTLPCYHCKYQLRLK